MSLYLISIWIDGIILVLCLIFLVSERNPILGIRIPATLSDPEIWKKTHKKASKILCTVSLVHLFLLLLTHSDYYAKVFNALLLFLFIVLLLYIIYYANTLYEERFPTKAKKINLSKSPFLNKLLNNLRKLNPGFAKTQFWI